MSTPQTVPPAAPTAIAPPPAPLRMRPRDIASLIAHLGEKDLLRTFSRLPGDSGLLHFKVAGESVVFVRDPEHARQVLVTNQDNYIKGNDYKILAVLLGRGLLTNFDLDLWQRQRKLVQPIFAKRHLAPMATHMTAATESWLDRRAWEAPGGGPVDVNAAMMELTLDVVCRALFGTTTDAATTKTVGRSMDALLTAAQKNLSFSSVYDVVSQWPKVKYDSLLTLRRVHWNRAQRAKAALDEIVYGLIDGRQRGASVDDADDLLALLLAARDEDGTAMDRELVRDEVMTFLGAGHETTANALTWLWLCLSRNPEARRRMEAEVDEVLEGRVPTFEDADRLPWTSACLQEAMRLYPPVPAFTRVAAGPDEIDGVKIARGSDIIIATSLMHRNPRLWENPEGFDPERFMPGAPSAVGRPRLAFMPFGAGRRICVGQGFALLEGTLLAAMITQRLRIDLVSGARIRNDVAITLRPRGGMPMTVTER